MDYEIIKIDAELETCPETGVRYFGYVKYVDATANYYWGDVRPLGSNIPWFISVEELIDTVEQTYSNTEVLQVIVLKAELPIKKLVTCNE